MYMQGLAPLLSLMPASVKVAGKTVNDAQFRNRASGEAKLALLLWSGCVGLLRIPQHFYKPGGTSWTTLSTRMYGGVPP